MAKGDEVRRELEPSVKFTYDDYVNFPPPASRGPFPASRLVLLAAETCRLFPGQRGSTTFPRLISFSHSPS